MFKERRKTLEQLDSVKEKLDFFPFISGDLVEQQRNLMKQRLKGELSVYLTNSRTNKQIRSVTPKRLVNNLANQRGYEDLNKWLD